MDIYEIISKSERAGFVTGLDDSGVNFLDPADAFEVLKNGYVYRQELKSRMGFSQFGDRLGSQLVAPDSDGTRVMGIFENINPINNGTKELLVITKKYLYSYTSATNKFNKIPFNARLDPVPGVYNFNISSNDEYVSGTSYFTKTGTKRFVFTGKGMSAIYFYDGTEIGQFNYVTIPTTSQDNPDYVQPTEGALTKATKVHWFGERLNFFVPRVNGITYNQGVLYSGIRDNTGKGDQFNVPGSGLLSADTYELMKGTINLGDNIIMKFQSSDWSIEKTRDVFNPYFIKKIPSVIGTDATFSAVAWNNEAKSVGKTGLITTDGRISRRFDTKIPNFTRDEIKESNIDLTYGGYSRSTNQFMFAYKSSESSGTDEIQDRVLIYNYVEKTWSIYEQRFSVFGETNNGPVYAWNEINSTVNASWSKWNTTDEIWNKIGIGTKVQLTLTGDDEGYIYTLNTDYDDYNTEITGISLAESAVINTVGAYKTGDEIYIRDVIGMTSINELDDPFLTVEAVDATSITVNFKSINETAYVSGGIVVKRIEFEAKLSPFNPYRDQGRSCYVSHIEFLINSGFGVESVDIDLYEDGEDSPFKSGIKLIPNEESKKKREWITAIVDQESNFLNVVMKNENVLRPIIISSIRIHCSPGSITGN